MRALFFIAVFLLSVISPGTAKPKVEAVDMGNRIDFTIDGNLFTSYIFSEFEKYPFFYPVNGPSKASVTSYRNANFPHHSSIFFGCDKVNGGNYWQEGIERGQISSVKVNIIETGSDRAVIENECIWIRPDAQSPVKDRRKITISAPSPDRFIIDFNIEIETLMNVTVEKTNHSLFSVRMDPDLSVINGGTMVNAEGETGEKSTFGKRSGWIDCYGTRLGKSEGLAILQHPSNPDYASPWFTRDYGFFSPTPMYWPENGVNYRFGKGEVVELRYRVIVHSGTTEEADIAGEFKKYSLEH